MTKSFVLYSIVLMGVIASSASGGYLQDKLIASDGQANDHFGRSVSLSSNTCVVGAFADDDDTGSVYVYRFDGESFSEEAKLFPSDDAIASRFGYSVSIDNDVCIAGAFEDDENGGCSGSAYVFFSDGDDWFYEAKLLASDGSSGDSFGSSVSIDQDLCIVGARSDDDNGYASGSAYIFRFEDPNEWVQEAKIVPSDSEAVDYFGHSVSVYDQACIVGAHLDDDDFENSGSAYIYGFDGQDWYRQAKLFSPDQTEGQWFGYSVDISADICIVGARDDDGDQPGGAYIFRYDDPNWVLEQQLIPSDSSKGDLFGFSVALDGDVCAVSAPGFNTGDGKSSIYVFRFDGQEWIEEQQFLSPDPRYQDLFGESVAVDSGLILVGNSYKDSFTGTVYTFLE